VVAFTGATGACTTTAGVVFFFFFFAMVAVGVGAAGVDGETIDAASSALANAVAS
jgi:hypothetical protein